MDIGIMLRVVLLASHFCLAVLGGRAWNLYDYKLYKQTKLLGIPDNASGAAYNPHTNTFWVVVNKPVQLHEYDTEGKFKKALSCRGFWDPEAITWMYGNTFGVAEENAFGTISVIDVSGKSVSRNGPSLKMPRTGGRGIEGMAYNRDKNVFYVTLEQSPQALFEVERNGDYKYLMNLEHLGLGDISDMHYEARDDMFYFLSQESRKVVKMSAKGKKLQEIKIVGLRPEGLSFTTDGRTMFVVSEPDELAIYRV